MMDREYFGRVKEYYLLLNELKEKPLDPLKFKRFRELDKEFAGINLFGVLIEEVEVLSGYEKKKRSIKNIFNKIFKTKETKEGIDASSKS